MSQVVFFLEEATAKALLESLLARLFPDLAGAKIFCYKVYEGKRDLQKNLVRDLRHYQVPGA